MKNITKEEVFEHTLSSIQSLSSLVGELVKPTDISGLLTMYLDNPHAVGDFNKNFIIPALKQAKITEDKIVSTLNGVGPDLTEEENQAIKNGLSSLKTLYETVEDMASKDSKEINVRINADMFSLDYREANHERLVSELNTAQNLIETDIFAKYDVEETTNKMNH